MRLNFGFASRGMFWMLLGVVLASVGTFWMMANRASETMWGRPAGLYLAIAGFILYVLGRILRVVQNYRGKEKSAEG